MDGRLLAQARGKKTQIREANRAQQQRRQQEIYSKIPEIESIDNQCRTIMAQLVSHALRQAGPSVEQLEADALSLQEKKADLLEKAGYPRTYLNPIYSCPLCQDSGIYHDANCECLLSLYKLAQTEELAPLLNQEPGDFNSFRLDYYSDIPTEEGKKSPRETMKFILSICKDFADRFSKDSRNLLLSGSPGLGKTFLAAAMARSVAAKNFSVAYDTASGLLASFEQEKFNQDNETQSEASRRVRQLMNCDLLIIDDLGTEMPTSFTQSALYTLLDGRLRNSKKCVITTNLSKDQLQHRYGEQLGSRLSNEYLWLVFAGRDIRSIKKERGE